MPRALAPGCARHARALARGRARRGCGRAVDARGHATQIHLRARAREGALRIAVLMMHIAVLFSARILSERRSGCGSSGRREAEQAGHGHMYGGLSKFVRDRASRWVAKGGQIFRGITPVGCSTSGCLTLPADGARTGAQARPSTRLALLPLEHGFSQSVPGESGVGSEVRGRPVARRTMRRRDSLIFHGLTPGC